MNVLLVGPWAPAALAFARSLQRLKIGVHLLSPSTAHDRRWTFSALEGSATIPAHCVATQQGIDLIKRYVDEIGASALVAIVDADLLWLAEHRSQFEPACRLLMPATQSLCRLRSKQHQIDLAKSAGLSVLPTYLVMQPEDADLIPASEFPVALRPDCQDGVEPPFKIQLATSRQRLLCILRDCRRIASPIIAQPFKRLPNLLVHGVRSSTGEPVAARCYAVPRKFEGVSLTVEPRSFPDGFQEMCHEFACLAGITGCYHIEFLFSPTENRAYFLEVNVRLGGTTDKVVWTGFDEPSLLLQAFGVGLTQSSEAERCHKRVANKRVLIKHIVSAATGRLMPYDYPNVSRLKHIGYSCRDLIVAKDSIFDYRDVFGSIRFHLR